MSCESCKQQAWLRSSVIDFKRLTLLDIKYDRTLPFGHQALERLYACCNCGKRWHVSLARKWPTDPLPDQDWWAETPASTSPEIPARHALSPPVESRATAVVAERPGLRRVRKPA